MRNDRCMADGCEIPGVRCNYTDRHSRPCTTRWCARHWVTVGRSQYCRRHANLVEDFAGFAPAGGWPDVDNRAASLAAWVGRQLDPVVNELFTSLSPDGEMQLVNDPVHLVLAPGGARRWQRSWKLLDHASVVNRVAIEVDESNDADVLARVDTELIGHGVPPWIEHRHLGTSLQSDTAARREFLDSIARSIELVVTKQEMVPLH